MIHAISHFYHEKRVAWVSISMHACDPVPIVMGLPLWSFGPPEFRYKNGQRKRFTNVPDSEIMAIQEYARPENTKKVLKFCLKVFKGWGKKSYRRSTFEQFQDMSLAITDFINLSNPDCQSALHLALTEIDTEGLNGRSIRCYTTKHLHKYFFRWAGI